MTAEGWKLRKIFRAFQKLWMVLSNTIIFLGDAERLSPSIGSPMISKPSLGTFSISILPMAPKNRNWAPGNFIFSALAMATAGKICPPVPPPLKMNFGAFWDGVVFLSLVDTADDILYPCGEGFFLLLFFFLHVFGNSKDDSKADAIHEQTGTPHTY